MQNRVCVALLAMVAAAVQSAASASPTTGVYDEDTTQPNTVDFLASGSSESIAQLKSDVTTAYG